MDDVAVMILNISNYRTFIFDFDGVILNSNSLKEGAIRQSLLACGINDDIEGFVRYFTKFNGVPRRDKIEKYFSGGLVENILNSYSAYVNSVLFNADLIPGVASFLAVIKEQSSEDQRIYVLSGGERGEIESVLLMHGLNKYIDGIYAAPSNKLENIRLMNPSWPCIFFGDSLVDYEVALTAGLDFVFVYGASQVENWRFCIEESNVVASVRDFLECEFSGG